MTKNAPASEERHSTLTPYGRSVSTADADSGHASVSFRLGESGPLY
jgi:hypothetical protein